VRPTFAPVPERDQSSSAAKRAGGYCVPGASVISGSRPSYSVARLVNVAKAGFFAPLRLTRPLFHPLVGSSRRMNQMNTCTFGSPAAKSSACRR
jgi:hypothetical protein